MDPAASFLHRQERKAIERRRKKEPLLAVAPAYHEARLGLLAVTPTRVLFACRRWLGTSVRQWLRRELKGARLETKRYGVVQIATKAGVMQFELTNSEHKGIVMGALLPPQRKVDPIKQLTRRQAPRAPRAPSPPLADPLAHRQTDAYAAKLRDMVARGVMTQKEMDWQLGK